MAEVKKWISPVFFARSARFVINRLPKDFFVFSERGKPYLPVKSVLAVVFIWQRGKIVWQIIAFQYKVKYASEMSQCVRTVYERSEYEHFVSRRVT